VQEPRQGPDRSRITAAAEHIDRRISPEEVVALDGFDHIHVFVADRAAALAWYADVLGFVPAPELVAWAADGGPLQRLTHPVDAAIVPEWATSRPDRERVDRFDLDTLRLPRQALRAPR